MGEIKRELREVIRENKMLGLLEYKLKSDSGEGEDDANQLPHKKNTFHMYNSSIKELTKEIPKNFFSSSLIEFNELMRLP